MVIEPFVQADSTFDDPVRFDLREAHWFKRGEDYTITVGLAQVRWGLMETKRLVDVVNQLDVGSGSLGRAALGQPMVNVTVFKDWGALDVYWLPYVRERRYPGLEARPGIPIAIDGGESDYESDWNQWHQDFAVRYETRLGGFDLGLSQFYGTERDPSLTPYIGNIALGGAVAGGGGAGGGGFRDNVLGLVETSEPNPALSLARIVRGVPLWRRVLVNQIQRAELPELARVIGLELRPEYDLMYQAGIDLQTEVAGAIVKFEGIYRTERGGRAYAASVGLERRLSNVFGTGYDMSGLLEYHFETRTGNVRPPVLGNDLFVGAQWSFNDRQSTAVSLGAVLDVERGSAVLAGSLQRQLAQDWIARLSINAITNTAADDTLSFVDQDDAVRLDITWFF